MVSVPDHPAELAAAAWRTWGARGLVRRTRYEAVRRSGRLREAEQRWPATCPPGARLRAAGTTVPVDLAVPADPGRALRAPIVLYGSVPLGETVPPDWHRHGLTGHRFDPAAHWSALSDSTPEAGDIKDVWELSRFGWLQRALGAWAATGDEAIAEGIWQVIEDWHGRNPRYCGPHWMCGQETSLRTIATMFLADALAGAPATTEARLGLVAQVVHDAVGRVAPTLGYALSQRNNHASSEAGFLWSAAVLAPWLPDAARLQDRAARALAEVVADQFAPDGSYAQHSPTYQRVALHVLLWCLSVERATGAPAPDGVADAVARSVPFLRSLVAPGSEGRVPDLGGNDGALVFDLTDAPITDLRPVIAHAAAATGQPSGLGAGPWDQEAAWFGLSPRVGPPRPARLTGTTHPLTRGRSHAVVRAGALGHRPAHADQLHTDIWLEGTAVAVDPGSYRYTAPAPWGNALAGDDVHNLPRHPGAPQAQRVGRFFWRSWCEATVRRRVGSQAATALVADLELPLGTRLRRMVAVASEVVVVVDQASGPGASAIEVRWNLRADALELAGADRPATRAHGPGWSGIVVGGPASTSLADDDDPGSGWEAVTYGARSSLRPLVVSSDGHGRVVSAFAIGAGASRLDAVVGLAAGLDLGTLGLDEVEALLSAGA